MLGLLCGNGAVLSLPPCMYVYFVDQCHPYILLISAKSFYLFVSFFIGNCKHILYNFTYILQQPISIPRETVRETVRVTVSLFNLHIQKKMAANKEP